MAVLVAVAVWLALILVNAQNVKDMLSLLCLFVGLGIGVFLFMLASFADKKYTQKKVHKNLNRLAYFLFMAGVLIMCIVSYDPVCDPFFTVFLAFGLLVFASILILKMNVRSNEGCRELGDILGLKKFIEVAEKSRLEALVKDNPQMFYQILPYAYVLGVYDEWCKKFESIDAEIEMRSLPSKCLGRGLGNDFPKPCLIILAVSSVISIVMASSCVLVHSNSKNSSCTAIASS